MNHGTKASLPRKVDVEKVGIETRLYQAEKGGEKVKVALAKVPPYPIENVKATVSAQREQIVGGDCLGFVGLGNLVELWKDGDTLENDTKGPKDLDVASATLCFIRKIPQRRSYLGDSVLVGKEQRKHRTGTKNEMHRDDIQSRVPGCFESDLHGVANVPRDAQKGQFEEGIVIRAMFIAKEMEEVQVAGSKNE